MNRWTPRGKDGATFHAPVDGVPPWMLGDLKAWIDALFPFIEYEAFLRGFDKATQRTDSVTQYGGGYPSYVLEQLLPEERLDLVEFMLYWLEDVGHPVLDEASQSLEVVLAQSSSKWRVGRRGAYVGLEERVPEGVALAADETVANWTAAGALLAEAWRAALGRSPDYEEAYEKAIKAVEEAGAGKVAPGNNRTTLGTMAQDMENQGDWRLPLGENPRHPAGAMPSEMVRALWEGQESRHGGNGYRKPTREEAEAAVLLAVPLVQWFESDVLQRRK